MPIPPNGYLIDDNWRLAGVGVQVGEVVGGDAQIVAGPTPWWTCSLTYRVPRSAHFEWEAWIESMRGQLITEQVVPTSARMMHGSPVAWTGGVLWSGGIGWGPDAIPRLTVAAPQFAATITVDEAAEFTVGRFFFLDDHCYRTTAISGNTVSFQPGLRKAASFRAQIRGTGTVPMYGAEQEFPELPRTGSGSADITLRMKERINDAA